MKLKLLKQTNPQCHLYAAAMLLDEDPLILVTELGTDGLEKWYPTYTGQEQNRGLHEQEILNLFLRRGKALVKIEHYPTLKHYDVRSATGQWKPIFDKLATCWSLEDCSKRMAELVTNHYSLLIGQYKDSLLHAVACDGEYCYDPNGVVYLVEDFNIKEAWIVIELGIKSKFDVKATKMI